MSREMRIGRFSISRSLIDFELGTVKDILRDIVIVKAEYNYSADTIDYIGMCDSFKLIDTGVILENPLYHIVFGEPEVVDGILGKQIFMGFEG